MWEMWWLAPDLGSATHQGVVILKVQAKCMEWDSEFMWVNVHYTFATKKKYPTLENVITSVWGNIPRR